MTRILLCGCNGKMGRVIAACVKEREDCKIVAGIDIHTDPFGIFRLCLPFRGARGSGRRD